MREAWPSHGCSACRPALVSRSEHAHELRCRSTLHFLQVVLLIGVPLWAASASAWPWQDDADEQQGQQAQHAQQQPGEQRQQQQQQQQQQQGQWREQQWQQGEPPQRRRRRAGGGLLAAQRRRASGLLAFLFRGGRELDPLHFFMLWWVLLGALWVLAKAIAFKSLPAVETTDHLHTPRTSP